MLKPSEEIQQQIDRLMVSKHVYEPPKWEDEVCLVARMERVKMWSGNWEYRTAWLSPTARGFVVAEIKERLVAAKVGTVNWPDDQDWDWRWNDLCEPPTSEAIDVLYSAKIRAKEME